MVCDPGYVAFGTAPAVSQRIFTCDRSDSAIPDGVFDADPKNLACVGKFLRFEALVWYTRSW